VPESNSQCAAFNPECPAEQFFSPDLKMQIKRFLKWTLFAAITLVVVAGILLFTLDLGFLRGAVEERVSRALGREFSIDDELSIRLGRDLVLQAESLRLANAAWAEGQDLVRIGRLNAVLDPWSAWNGPLLIRRIELDDLDVSLLQNEEGLGNWQITASGATEEPGAEALPFLIEALVVTDANIEFQSSVLDRPLQATVDRMEQRLESDGLIHSTLDGELNGRSMSIEGSGGPYARLIKGDDISIEGGGSFGSMKVTGTSSFDNIWAPRRPAIDLRLAGSDFEELTTILGIAGLGGGDVGLRLTTIPAEDKLSVKVAGNLGRFSIDINSEMPSLAEITRAAFDARVSGPNFGRVARLAGSDGWPEQAFELNTTLRRPGNALQIERFNLALAGTEIDLNGVIPGFPNMSGAELELLIDGPGLEPFRNVIGLETVPAGAFNLAGSVSTSNGATSIDVRYQHPLASGLVTGVLGSGEGMTGMNLAVRAEGPNAGELGRMFGFGGLAAEAWSLSLPLSIDDPAFYDLGETVFSTSGLNIKLQGRVGADAIDAGTDLKFSVQGERLSDYQELAGEGIALPEQPFAIEGQAKAVSSAWEIRDIRGNLGTTSFSLNGRLGTGEALAGTNLSLKFSGTDLGKILEVPGQARFPDGPFTLDTGVGLDGGRLSIGQLDINAGAFSLKLDADIPWPPNLTNGRFQLDTRGVNITRVLPELAGLTLDEGDYEVRAGGSWRDGTISIQNGVLRIGNSSLTANGSLDLPPNLSATDMSFSIQSPDLSELGTINGERWGKVPFDLQTSFAGTPTKFEMFGFRAQLGESGIKGSFAMDFEPEIPEFDLRLSTTVLNLKPFQIDSEESDDTDASAPENDAKFIPDSAFPMAALAGVNGRFAIAADRVFLKRMTLENSVLTGEVLDGAVQINELGTDGYGGRLVATLSLMPGPESAAKLSANIQSTGLVLDFTDQPEEEKEALPPFDIDINLQGTGTTVREAAAALNGHITVYSPGGSVRNIGKGAAKNPLLAQVVSAISPSASRQDVINISCFAAVISARDGVLLLDPGVAMQSDKLNLFASGNINLAMEKIDVNFRTKTRKAVDLSVSEVFSPYVKLSGTLASPKVAVDPKGTLLSGGAAYLSGGLSILAKKALDQLGGTKDPCAEYLEKAQQEEQ
jgi:uncharacterized protein involved in outer membrane biogenesis